MRVALKFIAMLSFVVYGGILRIFFPAYYTFTTGAVGGALLVLGLTYIYVSSSEAINTEVNRIKALRKELEETVQNSGGK